MKNALKFVAVFTTLLCFGKAWAGKEVRFNDLSSDLGTDDQVHILGYRGTVKITPVKNSRKLVVHASKTIDDHTSASDDPWIFGVRREGKIVYVEMKGPDSPTKWETALKQNQTEMHFEIEAPSIAMDVIWRDGSVRVQNWADSLTINLLDGVIDVNHASGPIHIQNQTGEMHFANNSSRIDIETLKAKINVKDCEGGLQIHNFSGETDLANVDGSIRFYSRLGRTQIVKSSGSLEIENGKGNLNISDFSGSIRGQTDEGSVTAKIDGDVEVNFESVSGSMSFKLPDKSGAYYRMQSEDGTITAPDAAASGKKGTLKVASGRMPGESKGSIVLKSKSANLRVH